MTDRVDCRVFEDRLDALVRGELPDDARAQLRAHAAGCPECDALLGIQDHLMAASLETLEDRVPEEWVASMWEDVRGALMSRRTRRRQRPRWAVSLLAAAALALLFASGLTLRAFHRAEARAAALTSQLLDQQRRLARLEGATAGTAGGGVGSTGADLHLRALRARGELTVAELRTWLRDLPADTRLIPASRTGALDRRALVPGIWRDALSRLEAAGEVTAGDLLTVLDDLDLAGGTSVPTSRLLELLG